MEKGNIYLLKEQSDFCMSFVVCIPEGKVIVIDGGHMEDAAYLQNFLAGHEIEAWIITHAHPDHIYAVNHLLSDTNCSLHIKKFIYHFPPTDFVYEHEPLYAPYQAEFLRLASGYNAEVIIPEAGDVLTFDSLKMHIIMTTEPSYLSPVLNNHSLIFRLDSPHHRALFLGDLEPDGGDRLLEKTKNDPGVLKADIVQVAHHGHMSVDRAIYEIIMPSIAMWCAPLWLYDESEDEIRPRMYGTRRTRRWLSELGVKENYVSYEGTHAIPFD